MSTQKKSNSSNQSFKFEILVLCSIIAIIIGASIALESLFMAIAWFFVGAVIVAVAGVFWRVGQFFMSALPSKKPQTKNVRKKQRNVQKNYVHKVQSSKNEMQNKPQGLLLMDIPAYSRKAMGIHYPMDVNNLNLTQSA